MAGLVRNRTLPENHRTQSENEKMLKHERVIIHLDIDCFYAQAEIVTAKPHRDLENLPVGVLQNQTISTCNYVARQQFGLPKMTHVKDAKEMCPQLVIIPANMNLYRRVSDTLFLFVATEHFSQEERKNIVIEQSGIDECYLDVTKQVGGDLMLAVPLATRLREAIFEKHGYTTSAGISFNKLMSKIACNQTKPNGQSVIGTLTAARRMLQDRSLETIPKVGYQTAKKLYNQLGVTKVSEMSTVSYKELNEVVGDKLACHILQLVQAVDTSPVVEKVFPLEGSKSILKELTFLPVTTLKEADEKLDTACTELAERVVEDCERHDRYPEMITIRYSLDNYRASYISASKRHSFSETLRSLKKEEKSENRMLVCTSIAETLKKVSSELFRDKMKNNAFQLVRMGVHVSEFKPYTAASKPVASPSKSPGSIQSYLVKRSATAALEETNQPSKRARMSEPPSKPKRTSLLSYFDKKKK